MVRCWKTECDLLWLVHDPRDCLANGMGSVFNMHQIHRLMLADEVVRGRMVAKAKHKRSVTVDLADGLNRYVEFDADLS